MVKKLALIALASIFTSVPAMADDKGNEKQHFDMKKYCFYKGDYYGIGGILQVGQKYISCTKDTSQNPPRYDAEWKEIK